MYGEDDTAEKLTVINFDFENRKKTHNLMRGQRESKIWVSKKKGCPSLEVYTIF